MSDSERKGPTRWQAKVWTDTVLGWIVKRNWFSKKWEGDRKRYESNAIQIGQYFPEFGGAYDSWSKNPNSFNEQVLREQAEKVILALPVPYDQPDIQHELDAAEDTINELRQRVDQLKKDLDNSEKARQQGWNEANALRALLAKSIRVEEAEFDGDRGCRFILDKDHVVAEWRGDGIASDTVFSEHPSLEYGVTTTPQIRCIRMALEMAHWPVLCAMMAGPGDGKMKEIFWWSDKVDYERQQVIEYLRRQAEGADCEWELKDLAEAIERGDHVE